MPGYYTVKACRLVDTRESTEPPLGPGETRVVGVTGGKCGIPESVKAIALNVMAVAPAAPGYLALFPGDQAVPNVSTVNFRPGQVRANNAIVPIGADGTLGIFNASSWYTEFVVDVSGFFF